ncbi:LURP-one-related/scramblase family protein [Halolactibacillus sp. JCM 19043]|uniref:LURP-one-related/scramblase family protein n=1 Tax=Halolactibacillus sp. JCM 19043 TaxID=1460638 RepID=UPI001E4010BE|nr:LURP-one-related family protein [Halolactibacillus sp. JCM 19043]
MTTFYMRQKVFSLGEKFTITDQNEEAKYTVQGSFMQIPKQFTIYDQTNQAVGTITKKMISLLPAFYVSVDGFKEIMIQKAFTFFKTRFDIHAENIHIVGDIFDKYFEVHGPAGVIAYVEEKWFTWEIHIRLTWQMGVMKRLSLVLLLRLTLRRLRRLMR